MNLTDTHTHLYASQFNDDRDEILKQCLENKINRLFLPNIDQESVPGMLELAQKYPDNCFPMIGLHPCSVKKNWEQELHAFENLLTQHKFYAIGEIGMDLYWDKTFIEEQKQAFVYQIQLAKKYQLPIVIHVRDAFNEVFEVIEQHNDEQLFGIFHCFTGNAEQAQKIIDFGGFKMGIGGVLTFKNSGLDQVVSNIGMEHLVLETDSPYLAPHPYRGKRNQSDYLTIIAHKLAQIKNISVEEIAQITTKNSQDIFGI